MFPSRKIKHLQTKQVETESEFPTVVDIIKAGHADDTYDMIDGLMAEGSQTLH